ncbi:type II/IV secretion system protein [Candidatus Woesebacteria bacterium]|nr:type II/IV secretion system protein [Candidatus Woesebacteria bacterium]
MDQTPDITGAVSKEWLDSLLSRAIESRASDIHLEPARDAFHIRYRIDGLLYLIENLSMERHEPVVSRVKVVSQLDITEHRIPQDGHFEFTYGGLGGMRFFNIRVSTFPTIYGEAIVMRILNREDILINLEGLGFDQSQLNTVENLIVQPYGMVLITGPSGSGKTTLLYSILNALNKQTVNIITIEDPVELNLEGAHQTQISEETGLTFAKALRAVLRQDPDIMMVGEIRDSDSAQISMQAALTGRLVFSSFHTLNVFAVVARLLEMGVPRSIIANAIVGVIASRLVRKICNSCKTSYQPTPAETKMLGVYLETQKLLIGKGCDECRHSGYKGRVGIYEVVSFDEEIRTAIIEEASSSKLLSIIRGKKIKSLKEGAVDKVFEGITSIQEVVRVIGK